ncbi:hypothetical protein [Rhodococcus xishaensis]|uniref:hypothetical protein n=1 Tax=Rhodococcus xishaensis TaxID=2487364 RepID=UPI0038B4EED9
MTNGSNRDDASASATSASTRPGKGLLYLALGCFFVGIAAIVAIFFVHSLSEGAPGLTLYLLTLACPLGFVLAVVYALRSGRRSR